MDAQMQVVIGYLQNTLDPNPIPRREAEKCLQSIELQPGYAKLLLSIIPNSSIALHLRQQAAVTLKNFIKRNWGSVEGMADLISVSDRTLVKEEIVDLMLLSPQNLQNQLAESISLISQSDFPAKWPNLLPNLIGRMQSAGDFNVINGVLQTCHSLFIRYRHEMKSDKLWLEIKLVLEAFANPLTELFKSTVTLASQHSTNPAAAKVIYGSLVFIAEIFYSLNYQDLPEFFEDHLNDWMPRFLELLKTDVACLNDPNEETEPGLLEQLRSQISENVVMFAQKYEEEFQPFLPGFVEAIWNLLVGTGPAVKFDILVCQAIAFLACVCERPHYKGLFESGNTLALICEKVVVPNMLFRQADLELFEDNAEEFIRKDIEGSDSDTRRRAACDFVRSLCKQFETPVIAIFTPYIQQMLVDYSQNPTQNWPKKDAAIYLVTSLVARGVTAKMGVTQSTALVNLDDFFRAHILAELSGTDVNTQLVLKADALKYLVTFRTQLSAELLVGSMPLCAALLASNSQVVHTYAAHCIERIMTVREKIGEKKLIVTAAQLQPIAEPLMTNMFSIFSKPGSEENEYAMKSLMRVISTLKESVFPLTEVILNKLADKLRLVMKNPSKPHFNHYLFESICVMIREATKLSPATVGLFEAVLFPPFQEILTSDVTEFMPYVFQVLALMLSVHKEGGIPEPYWALFPFLLIPALWEKSGNVTGLVKLLQAYLTIDVGKVVSSGHLSAILGIFQKLVVSKMTDHEGFNLLNCLIENIKPADFASYKAAVFYLLFQRLSGNKTMKFAKGLIVFMSLFAIKMGPASLVQTCEDIQEGIFGMLLEKVIIADLQKVSGSLERKIVAVGVSNLLCDCPQVMITGKYKRFWPQLLTAVVCLFELPESDDQPGDELVAAVEETPDYSAAYSQLAFAFTPETDPTGVADVKRHLAVGLARVASSTQDVVGLIRSIDSQPQEFLQKYLTDAGVTI